MDVVVAVVVVVALPGRRLVKQEKGPASRQRPRRPPRRPPVRQTNQVEKVVVVVVVVVALPGRRLVKQEKGPASRQRPRRPPRRPPVKQTNQVEKVVVVEVVEVVATLPRRRLVRQKKGPASRQRPRRPPVKQKKTDEGWWLGGSSPRAGLNPAAPRETERSTAVADSAAHRHLQSRRNGSGHKLDPHR